MTSTTESKKPRITAVQAAYLKHAGAANDVKVSFCVRKGVVCAHIQDFEFESFEAALRHLQEDGRNLVRESENKEMEVL